MWTIDTLRSAIAAYVDGARWAYSLDGGSTWQVSREKSVAVAALAEIDLRPEDEQAWLEELDCEIACRACGGWPHDVNAPVMVDNGGGFDDLSPQQFIVLGRILASVYKRNG